MKLCLLVAAFFSTCLLSTNLNAQVADADPARFTKAINAFAETDHENEPAQGGIVIVGSSSVKRLDTEAVFPGFSMINRGFGGAHISDVNHYVNQTVLKYRPSTVVFFCGGNDLWSGHTIEEVLEDFEQFTDTLFGELPDCRLIVLALRPSPKRIEKIDTTLRMNDELGALAKEDPRITFLRDSCDRFLDTSGQPIPSMYADDNLHMNDVGYQVWKEIVTPHLRRPDAPFKDQVFDYEATPAEGLGLEESVMRRDPSDVIKVDDLYYVWYTRHTTPGSPSGYDASIWYATSKDGHHWDEHEETLPRGGPGTWDEHSVFTPNILVAEGRYWLFYTAVSEPFDNSVSKTAIGLAVSDSPDGPWKKLDTNPILSASDDPEQFDSMRVDDACLIVREGKYWFYFKGRQWNNTPGKTKLGLALADKPEGPYVKHEGNPLLPGGHEVVVWPYGSGVVALIGRVGPKGLANTLQYSEDGITFTSMARLKRETHAAGTYRPEAFTQSGNGQMADWGVHIGNTKGFLPYLERFDFDWNGDSP